MIDSTPGNLILQIITQSEGFATKGIGKVSKSLRAYIYLFLPPIVQESSRILQYFNIIDIKSVPGKIYGNSGMTHFAKTNQVPSPYSMLQDIRRVAIPKLVPRHCLRYLQTTLIMGGGGLVSEFMRGIVE